MASLRDKLEHRFAQRRMSDYVDSALSQRQRRRIARHADLCPECGPLRRSLLRLTVALRELRRPPPRSIAPRVVERLRASEHEASIEPALVTSPQPHSLRRRR